jgi:hypothetical protein
MRTETAAPARLTGTYRLFLRPGTPGLLCAIPENQPAPAFLLEGWLFSRCADAGSAPPAGFNERVARLCIGVIGFYLFERADTSEPTALAG